MNTFWFLHLFGKNLSTTSIASNRSDIILPKKNNRKDQTSTKSKLFIIYFRKRFDVSKLLVTEIRIASYLK